MSQSVGRTDHRSDRLAAVFRDKPEMVTPLPLWMLPEKQIEAYRNMKELAIVEIAGRDSVAAAVKGVMETGYRNLLPVYAYTGTEHGSWASVEEAVNRLTRRLPQIEIQPLLIVGSPGFWRALNGRFVTGLIDRFGYYTPCTGCHLYLHAIRIPLSHTLGKVPIIAGERKAHGQSVKINQVKEALDFYTRFASAFDIHLHLPLAEIIDDRIIEEILEMPWKRDRDQLGCILSGNYKKLTGDSGIDVSAVTRFFDAFAGPLANTIIHRYLENQIPDHEKIACRVMEQLDAQNSCQNS